MARRLSGGISTAIVNFSPLHEHARFQSDRPQQPHDWRWLLGIVGRILVSVGVLLFAFVAYQLWGTGIQTAREQDRLRAEFDDLLEAPVPTSSPMTITTAMPIEPTSTDLPEASFATSLDPIVTVPPTVAST